MIYTKNGPQFILVKGRLEKPVSSIIQDVVHIDALLLVDPFSWIDQCHFASVGGSTVCSRIPLKNKITQLQREWETDLFGTIRNGKLCITGSYFFRLSFYPFVSVYIDI